MPCTAASSSFFAGLGAGLLIAIYDYLGYFTVAYMGDEMKEPGRTLPRAIVYSIVGMMVIYLVLNVGVVGTLPWHVMANSDSVASLAVSTAWGHTRQWLYPLPTLLALVGWVYHSWPFGPRRVQEVYLDEQRSGEDAQLAHAHEAPS